MSKYATKIESGIVVKALLQDGTCHLGVQPKSPIKKRKKKAAVVAQKKAS